MARSPAPALAAVVRFIDCINRTDLYALADLLHDDHRLEILDEEPLVGREANVSAWKGYFEAFPDYVIYPRYLTDHDGRVVVVGTTTGSHLGLPDVEESKLSVLWHADVDDGLLTRWAVLEDNPQSRAHSRVPTSLQI